MKRLVLYYSYGGNTESVAEIIADAVDADLASIDTLEPYEGGYDDVVEQGHEEVDAGFMPEIAPLTVNLDDYDAIYLGTPVWWYTMAPAVHTLVDTEDFAGKTIYPFVTNGGWPGHALDDVADVLAAANVHDGLDVRFDEHTMRTSRGAIEKWARATLA